MNAQALGLSSLLDMASYFLPSFLTGWELPSVSAFSLSANLQKRILSYLLKRTLGHFVDGGQLDPTQLDAGIGSGRIEIRDIELDAAALNQRLAPFRSPPHPAASQRSSSSFPCPISGAASFLC